MAATIIGVIGIVLIALASLVAAVTVVLAFKDPAAVSAAKDYVLIAATAVGTLGGFVTGYVKGRSEEVKSSEIPPVSLPSALQYTSTTTKEEE